jgi:glycosyltransferase involved in cell wall biosynthesis
MDAPSAKLLYRLGDVAYAARVLRQLPPADVTVTNSVALPLLLSKRSCGLIYVSVNRYPKRQMGFYKRADRLQAVSAAVSEAIRAQSPEVAHLVKVVPNAVGDVFARQLHAPPQPKVARVLYVGRIAREKGLELLLRAFALAGRMVKGWRLELVGPWQVSYGGDGERYLDELKALARALAIDVTFTGPIFDEMQLVAQYASSEIFVYPSIASKGESFGVAPLEAMCCGAAVVTSSLECFRDYLTPDRNGLIFPEGDVTGVALAEQLQRLMASPRLRAELAGAGTCTAALYTPDAVARLFLSDFEELLSTRAGGASLS